MPGVRFVRTSRFVQRSSPGFPGETEEEFQYLLDFLKEARLNRVGCFAYSPVEGAAANDLPGALPESVRVERRERFMEVQSEISKELLREKVGKTIKVLVDEAPDEDGIATARSTADAPDIDGLVFIENNPNVNPGRLCGTSKSRILPTMTSSPKL